MKREISLKNGKKIVATIKKVGETNAMLKMIHFKYYVTLEVEGKKNGFIFHDSNANWRSNKRIDEQMLFDAIDCHLDDVFDYENSPKFIQFATEFGYGDEDWGCAKRAFEGCRRANEGLRELLTWSEIEEFNEIVRKKLHN